MKNLIILAGVTITTLLLACLEYLSGCPFEWPLGEIIGGTFLWIVGLIWSYRLYFSFRKLIMPLVGGLILIVAVNVAINALFLWKMLLDACPDMTDGIFVILTMMMAVYIPFVYVVAIWLYFYYFCGLREIFTHYKREI